MYRLDPAAVYAWPQLLDDPRHAARIERILRACDRSLNDLVLITPDSLADVISQLRDLERPAPRRRALVFGQLKTGDSDPDWEDLLSTCPEGTSQNELVTLYGHGTNLNLRRREYDQQANHVCWCAREFNTIWGCSHGCQYCGMGRRGDRLVIGVNLEDYAEKIVRPALEQYPWQKCYRLIGAAADQITFEPEYGASELLGGYFARQPDRYLMLYTKSANVDHLLGLDHRGHTIVCWSLSCDTVSRLVEKHSATTAERIAAAEACQQAGYPVRVRFSPFVPVRNWRDENAAMIEEYFRRVRPDIVTMDTFKWLEPRVIGDILDLGLWDDEYRGYVEQYAAMEPSERPVPIIPNGKQVFPHEARLRIYRFLIEHIRRLNATVPISLCGETPEMWEALRKELGMTPEHYVCTCGPDSAPGNPLLQ